MEKETKFLILATVFIAVMVFINLTGAKIIQMFGLTFSVSAFFYALTFPITDTVSECWGKARAQKVVWLGLIGLVFAAVATQIVVAIPPADFWIEQQEAFASTFQLVGRFAIGGIVAYLIAQSFDVWAFHWIRKKTHNKWLWVRNNGSTMVSQLVDTIIFISIGFFGTLPLEAFFSLLIGQYIMKIVIAGIDTPIVYLLRGWIGVTQELEARHQK